MHYKVTPIEAFDECLSLEHFESIAKLPFAVGMVLAAFSQLSISSDPTEFKYFARICGAASKVEPKIPAFHTRAINTELDSVDREVANTLQTNRALFLRKARQWLSPFDRSTFYDTCFRIEEFYRSLSEAIDEEFLTQQRNSQ